MLTIRQNKDGKWYFWDEIWSEEIGPYDTISECRRRLKEYTDYLDLETGKRETGE